MGLQNLYSDLSNTSGYPNHENPELNYGAGSPIFGGMFEQIGLSFNNGTAYDQPDQNYSSEPFIKSPIQGGFADVGITFDSLTEGFIRGGATTHAKRLITDTERITKFYLSPRGVSFLAKQTGLQLSNPQIRPGTIFSSPPSNSRTYNLGANTLAQIAASGTGLHIKREGKLPTSFDGYINDLNLTKKDTNNDDYNDITSGNRLLYLFENKILPNIIEDPKTSEDEEEGGFLSGVGDVIDTVSTLLGGNTTDPLYSFNGGAGTTYGIGQTTLYRYDDTTTDSKGNKLGSISSKLKLGFIPGEYSTEDKKFSDGIRITSNPFSPAEKASGTRISLQSPGSIRARSGSKLSYSKTNIGQQTNKFTPSNLSSYHVSYNGTDPIGIQKVIKSIEKEEIQVYGPGRDDFIPFRFEAVNTLKPEKSDYIVFRAFLDDFQDNYNAEHNSFNYNGRGETFYTYNGFTRNINFNFKVAAQSKNEMVPLYQKLNYLVSNTAPEYSKAGRINTPYIKLTVGDWCNRLPGVLSSIGLSWQKDYPWDLGEKDDQRSSGLILPHVLDVQVQFIPIHQFVPEKSINSSFFNWNKPIANA